MNFSNIRDYLFFFNNRYNGYLKRIFYLLEIFFYINEYYLDLSIVRNKYIVRNFYEIYKKDDLDAIFYGIY